MSDCIFCKIAEKKIPSKIVHEDDRAVEFEDINPQAPVHVLVVPKRHVQSVAELNAADAGFLGHLLLTGAAIAKQRGIADSGYRLVLNTGKHGGQTVFHLHLHLLPHSLRTNLFTRDYDDIQSTHRVIYISLGQRQCWDVYRRAIEAVFG